MAVARLWNAKPIPSGPAVYNGGVETSSTQNPQNPGQHRRPLPKKNPFIALPSRKFPVSILPHFAFSNLLIWFALPSPTRFPSGSADFFPFPYRSPVESLDSYSIRLPTSNCCAKRPALCFLKLN
jgi:hypothetical protein